MKMTTKLATAFTLAMSLAACGSLPQENPKPSGAPLADTVRVKPLCGDALLKDEAEFNKVAVDTVNSITTRANAEKRALTDDERSYVQLAAEKSDDFFSHDKACHNGAENPLLRAHANVLKRVAAAVTPTVQ